MLLIMCGSCRSPLSHHHPYRGEPARVGSENELALSLGLAPECMESASTLYMVCPAPDNSVGGGGEAGGEYEGEVLCIDIKALSFCPGGM
jgi:hypothetical protein